MEYISADELAEAKKQIDSALHKTRQVLITFKSEENVERYKSQITLAKRRTRAFEIASVLVEQEIGQR